MTLSSKVESLVLVKTRTDTVQWVIFEGKIFTNLQEHLYSNIFIKHFKDKIFTNSH